MWLQSKQWGRALLGRNFQHHNNANYASLYVGDLTLTNKISCNEKITASCPTDQCVTSQALYIKHQKRQKWTLKNCQANKFLKTHNFNHFRPSPHVSDYFWIHNFFFPDTASVHTYPVNPADESAHQSGNFWILYMNPESWGFAILGRK